MPLKILYLAVGMLVLAVAPVPYGYFTILRLVTTAIFAWAAVESHRHGEMNLPWIFVGLGLLFNPFVKVHFSRGIWNAIDVSTAVFLLLVRSRITRLDPLKTHDGR